MSAPRRLLLSPRAVTDLEDIAAYIARDNPLRAAAFVNELEARCAAVARDPLSYPTREDLASELRVAVHGRYLVLFHASADGDAVRVERVVHGARDLRRLL
ncbi:MAG: type II toxin-antitoxin system RelE/ParE family toxin [Acetobacteraceae bacterium]